MISDSGNVLNIRGNDFRFRKCPEYTWIMRNDDQCTAFFSKSSHGFDHTAVTFTILVLGRLV